MIIDMHCHLDLYADPYDIAERCKEHDLYALSVTTTPKAWSGTVDLTKGNKKIITALGFHPQLAHQRLQEIELFDELLLKTKYIGEIGLDGEKDYKEFWRQQQQVFKHVLKSVDTMGGRIMSIHSRASVDTVLTELYHINGIAILHWFTGSKTELKTAINMGCWFSVNPSMLSTKKGQEIVALIPKDRLLTESDGPFAKLNGKQLMPWDVKLANSMLAKIWKIKNDEVELQIYSNFRKLTSTF